MSFEGQTPDTLDLVERARLGLNYLTNNPEEGHSFRPFFGGALGTDPASYTHCCWDFGDATGRFVESIILTRLVTGSRDGEEVEQGLRRFMLSLFREDGLSYRGSSRDQVPSVDGDMFFWDQGRVLYGLVTWYLRERDEQARNLIRGMVRGLKSVAVYGNGCAWFPYESMYQGKYVERPDMTQGLWAASGQPIEPLVRYYEDTGDEEALEFAGLLVRGLLDAPLHFFEPSGAFTLHELPYHYAFHVHSHTGALLGLLRYGIVVGDHELVAIGRRAYDWIKKNSSTSIGWTCEHYPFKTLSDDSQEVCCMVDLLAIAIMLAEAGYEQYWNDVERIARNHLVESQITSTSTYDPVLVGLKHLTQKIEKVDDGWSSYDRVIERTVGATGGSGWANELYRPPGIGISGCCTPHMIKGFYLTWSHIVTGSDDELRINLGLNFNSESVEVRSYLPHEGRVDVLPKTRKDLAVRIPDWVDKWDVNVSAGDRAVSLEWSGDYVRVRGAEPGRVVSVRYPLRQAWIREDVGTANFNFKWRGDTVVDVSPKGMVVPLYQRKALDQDEAPTSGAPILCAPDGFHLW